MTDSDTERAMFFQDCADNADDATHEDFYRLKKKYTGQREQRYNQYDAGIYYNFSGIMYAITTDNVKIFQELLCDEYNMRVDAKNVIKTNIGKAAL